MHQVPLPGRSHVDLAGVGLAVGDEFAHGLGRELGGGLHHIRHPRDAGDGRDVAQEVERQTLVKGRIDAIGGVDQQDRVAVGRGVHHHLGADVVAGAGPVVDHELLAEMLGKVLAQDSRQDVGGSGGRIGHHPFHRPGRIVLGPRGGDRERRQRHEAEQGECLDWLAHDVSLRPDGWNFLGRAADDLEMLCRDWRRDKPGEPRNVAPAT
jgi:hypothetical protein